jgi:hypothetical protein
VERAHGTSESTAGLTGERIAQNDAIFRDANERIRAVAEEHALDRVPFICECADPSCRELIMLTLAEYREVRADPHLFVNAVGHDAAAQGWAEVVASRDGHVVVEKIGIAGEIAEQLESHPDPAAARVEPRVEAGDEER